MTSAFESAFARRFRERLAERLKEQEANILEGRIDNYDKAVSYRRGLSEALEIANAVEKEMTEPEPERRRVA